MMQCSTWNIAREISGMESEKIIEGNLVDPVRREMFPGRMILARGRIVSIERLRKSKGLYILPGLVDAHVHIESSMLIPSVFAQLAVRSGTTQCVSDPHEIANVLGREGVRFMIKDAERTTLRVCFGAPSCVPATGYETSGAKLGMDDVKEMLGWKEVGYLSEVMNYPGVVSGEEEVINKINSALEMNLPVDGHAPGLTGSSLDRYIDAGISTDHECTTRAEAEEKLKKGMKILIRQGSAAKNLNELYSLVDDYPGQTMFCTDDIHPDDLARGHMNRILAEAVSKGCDFFNVLRAMTLNPMDHYGLERALLQPGDLADFIMAENLQEMNIISTYIGGERIYGEKLKPDRGVKFIQKPNVFRAKRILESDIVVRAEGEHIHLIESFDGKLYTKHEIIKVKIKDKIVEASVKEDVLKIVVLNRYRVSKPSIGFIRGFGLKNGAIASSIAHDSHNIISVGVNDRDISLAINYIVDHKGGIAVCGPGNVHGVSLPVAGIMTDQEGEIVAKEYERLNRMARDLGSKMTAPFMTLSFMSLLVIPEIKIGDRGLFDVEKFSRIGLFECKG